MFTARGVAAIAARAWLDECPAVEVESVREAVGYLDFKFDPAKQPAEVPEGVFFDLASSPF